MINEATELLTAFVQQEENNLIGVDIPHMPTLGKAYEEITKHAINKKFVIPDGLDLNIVSGFIKVGEEQIPNQIDCMLVKGMGLRIGLTDEYICDIENVLAIFEVKKTLNKDDFIDAYEHLAVLRKKYSEYFSNKMDSMGERPDISVASEIFSKITGRCGPNDYDGIYHLSEEDQILFYSLVIEQLAPVTIIHGYGGYKTEKGLRDSFLEYLDEENYIKNLSKKKIEKEKKKGDKTSMIRGINSMPTLITSNSFSLVKFNGLPYTFINTNKSDWAVIASCRENQLGLMLELIWSKISISFDVSMPWGDDDQLEPLVPLLFAKVLKKEEQLGWYYRSFEVSSQKLNKHLKAEYKPLKISFGALLIVRIMSFSGTGFTINDKYKKEFEDKGLIIEDAVTELVATSYFAINKNFLYTIHHRTYICDQDDFGYVDSQFKRVENWFKKNNMTCGIVFCIELS